MFNKIVTSNADLEFLKEIWMEQKKKRPKKTVFKKNGRKRWGKGKQEERLKEKKISKIEV